MVNSDVRLQKKTKYKDSDKCKDKMKQKSVTILECF